MTIKTIFILLFAHLLIQSPVFAETGKGNGGPVHVRGYTKKDGTVVQSYNRSYPGSGNARVGGLGGGSNAGSSGSPYLDQQVAPNVVVPNNSLQPAAQKSPEEKAEIDDKVIAWQIKRAEEGSASSQYDLGIRYTKGDGVKKDEEQGRSWLAKAAQQGSTQAYIYLKNTDYGAEMRDANGRIIRSSSARREFMKNTGFPNGRTGYVIDHILPLDHDGCDCPENMQWLTIEEAKAKEKAA